MLPPDPSINFTCLDSQLAQLAISTRPLYMVMLILQVSLCVWALKLMALVKRKLKANVMCANVVILVHFQRFFMYAYCVTFIPIVGYHFLQRFVTSGCSLLVPVKVCVLFRISQSWAIVFFQLFYTGVLFDRFGCLFFSWYFRANTKGAWVVGIVMSVMSLMSTGPSLPIDLASDKYMVNCASLEHKSVRSQRLISVWFLFLDIISIVLFVFLQQFRKREMKSPVFKFNLNKTLAEKELKRTIHMIFPMLIFNFVCYSYYSGVSLFNTTLEENNDPIRFLFANSVPIYLCGVSLIWMHLLRRVPTIAKNQIGVHNQENGADTHFRVLKNFWDAPLKTLSRRESAMSVRTQQTNFDDLSQGTMTTSV